MPSAIALCIGEWPLIKHPPRRQRRIRQPRPRPVAHVRHPLRVRVEPDPAPRCTGIRPRMIVIHPPRRMPRLRRPRHYRNHSSRRQPFIHNLLHPIRLIHGLCKPRVSFFILKEPQSTGQFGNIQLADCSLFYGFSGRMCGTMIHSVVYKQLKCASPVHELNFSPKGRIGHPP